MLFYEHDLSNLRRDHVRNEKKQFFKALNVEGFCLNYICRIFPKFSMEKLNGGIFK